MRSRADAGTRKFTQHWFVSGKEDQSSCPYRQDTFTLAPNIIIPRQLGKNQSVGIEEISEEMIQVHDVSGLWTITKESQGQEMETSYTHQAEASHTKRG